MKRISAAILVLLVSAATLMVAQGPPGPPDPAKHVERQVQRLTTILSLTSAQQQQATTIFTNAADSEKALRQQFRTAHDSLKAAVKSNNSAAIDQAASALGNLSAQSIAIKAKADAAFYQTLTSDQQAKYSELQSEGPMGFGHGPHGAFPH